jgi:hypothetical protein
MTPKAGWLSSEFWLSLSALAGKLVTLFFVLRTINASDPNAPNALINALGPAIVGVGAVLSIAMGQSAYINSRTQVKLAAMKS